MGTKLGFSPFFQVNIIFLDIAQDCSLGQCLTSRSAETSKNIYGPNQSLTGLKLGKNEVL